MDNSEMNWKTNEWCQKQWNDMREKQKKYKLIERLLALLENDELDDVIKYLGIILQKKEMRGDFDNLKEFLKKKENES